MNVGVLGASGRMGRLVTTEVLDAPDARLVAALVSPGSPSLGLDAGVLVGRGPIGLVTGAVGEGAFRGCDVVVDFSLPAGLAAALPHLRGIPLVTGTTGLEGETVDGVEAHARTAPVVQASNFSLGVNLLLDLVRRASGALPDADIEIVETHHRQKRDAPSGTALSLARAAEEGRGARLTEIHGRSGPTGARPATEIGIHALRGGDVVGEHTVWFLADGERVSFSHGASSRRTFARGALRAARWVLAQPPGRYGMDRVLGLDPRTGPQV